MPYQALLAGVISQRTATRRFVIQARQNLHHLHSAGRCKAAQAVLVSRFIKNPYRYADRPHPLASCLKLRGAPEHQTTAWKAAGIIAQGRRLMLLHLAISHGLGSFLRSINIARASGLRL